MGNDKGKEVAAKLMVDGAEWKCNKEKEKLVKQTEKKRQEELKIHTKKKKSNRMKYKMKVIALYETKQLWSKVTKIDKVIFYKSGRKNGWL